MKAPKSPWFPNWIRRALPSATIAITFIAAFAGAISVQADPLVWRGASANTNWDIGISSDWFNGTSLGTYADGSDVLFDDTATAVTPNLVTTVQPGSITVNATKNYTIAGVGSIAGAGGLVKNGTGTLIINTTNSFAGGVFINNGVVQVGKTNALGNAASVVTVNGGTLNLNGTAAMPYSSYRIQGAGYTNSGAVQNFSTTASSGGNGVASLILTGDATIGANGARWDLFGNHPAGSGLQGNGFTLTKVGPQDIFLGDGGADTGLGDINIVQGQLGFQSQPGYPGTGLGDPAKTLTVFPGSRFTTYRTPASLLMNKVIVFSNAFYLNSVGPVTFPGPVTLYGTNTQMNGFAETATDRVNFNGPINGTGSWIKTDIGITAFNGTNTYSGGTFVNTGTLVVGANSSLGSGLVQMGSGAKLDVTAATGGLTLASGQKFVGANTATVLGTITAGSGSIIAAGLDGPGLFTVDSLTMSGSTAQVRLGADPNDTSGAGNSIIRVNGNLNLSGMNTIQFIPTGPLNTSQPYTIIQYSGSLTGDLSNLASFSSSPGYTFTILDPATTAPYIQVQVTGVLAPLYWQGGAPEDGTAWDFTTANWQNRVANQTALFHNFDIVAFDDAALTNQINVTQAVNAQMTFNNANLGYTLTGNGSLSGTLDIEGTGAVTLALSNAPAFSAITNNAGTLVFNQQGPGSYAVTAPINDDGNGFGTIIKADTNTMVLRGNNLNYSGTITVTNGILQYINYSGLGQAFATLYLTNRGSLDFNDVNAGLKNIAIAGSGYNGLGALQNSSVNTASHVVIANLTLLGDATIGSNGRWDFPSTGATPNGGTLNGNGFNLTKVGSGQIWLAPEGGTGLGDINVAAGTLGFSPHVTDLGDPVKTLTVQSNASLYLWGNPNMLDKVLVLKTKTTINSGRNSPESSTNNLAGPVTLEGTNNTLAALSANLAFWNTLSGTGGFIKTGTSNLVLYGTNTYTGPTTINANSGGIILGANASIQGSSLIQIGSGSTLNVSAPATFNLGNNQVMSGSGTVIGGTVNFGSGSTLAAGGVTGTTINSLTMNGTLSLQSGSTNFVKLKKTTSVANDKTIGLASVTFGGTLVLTNIGTVALTSSDAIPLFSATNYSGSFTAIIPSTPGAGLTWNTNTLATDGLLRIEGTAINPTPTNMVFSVDNNQLTIQWPSDHTGWQLQVQTNDLSVGISTNWINVGGSTATNQMVFPVGAVDGAVFYRMILVQ